MSAPSSPPPADDTLHALVDGRLSDAERAQALAQLAGDPAAAATHAAWAAQREALRGLHADALGEPVPPVLLAAAGQAGRAQAQAARWRRYGGMAAGVAVAFAAGWAAHGQWPPAGTLAAAPGPRFVQQAALAHLVYAPERRHPVEVTADQQDHLVQWLSRRLGRPLKVPNLSAQGYLLVGGRLLPGEGGARAQFMFEDSGGQRVTLYLGAVDAGSARQTETAFSLGAGPVPSFYWVDQGFGYALAGEVPRARLLALAQAAYQQLQDVTR